jgi:hypothetical protein
MRPRPWDQPSTPVPASAQASALIQVSLVQVSLVQVSLMQDFFVRASMRDAHHL